MQKDSLPFLILSNNLIENVVINKHVKNDRNWYSPQVDKTDLDVWLLIKDDWLVLPTSDANL